MFNIISIYHYGLHNFPEYYFTENYKDNLIIHFLKKRNSILHLQPTIFSIQINGKILFSCKKIPLAADELLTDWKQFKTSLKNYLDEFLLTEYKKVNSQLDLVNFYLKTNKLEFAKSTLENMEKTPITNSLKLWIKKQNLLKNINLNTFVEIENFTESNFKENTYDKLKLENIKKESATSHKEYNTNIQQQTFNSKDIEKTKLLPEKDFKYLIENLISLEQNSRIFFVLSFLEFFSVEKLINLDSTLITETNLYHTIYLRLKIYNELVKRGYKKISAFFIISTALKLNSGLDFKIRRQWILEGIKLVESKSWVFIFDRIFEKIIFSDQNDYGFSLLSNFREISYLFSSLASPKSIENDNLLSLKNKNRVSIKNNSRIFKLDLFQTDLTNYFTQHLVLQNQYKNFIEMIVTDQNKKFFIFQDSEIIPIFLDQKVDFININEIITSKGEKFSVNYKFKRIKSEFNINLYEIKPSNEVNFFIFHSTGFKRSIQLKDDEVEIQFYEQEIIVSVPKMKNSFDLIVEIKENIFEELSFSNTFEIPKE